VITVNVMAGRSGRRLADDDAPLRCIGDAQRPERGIALAPLVPPAVRRASVIFDPTLAGWFVRAAIADEFAAWRHAAAGWSWLVPPAGAAAAAAALHQRCPPLADFLGERWPLTDVRPPASGDATTIAWPIIGAWRGVAWLTPGCAPGTDLAMLRQATPTLLGVLGSGPAAAWLTRQAAQSGCAPGDPAVVARLPLPVGGSEHEPAVAAAAGELVSIAEARARRIDDGLRRLMRDFAPPGATPDAALRAWWRHDVAGLLAAMRRRLGGAVPERFITTFAAWHAAEAMALGELERQQAAVALALDTAVQAWYGEHPPGLAGVL
jgi:hypothetical protein